MACRIVASQGWGIGCSMYLSVGSMMLDFLADSSRETP